MPKDILFHHYWPSPFSEKIRIIFGIKGITWSSVEIPSMMPKPDLMPLTGGYRRTPVMQVGADIYCDTQLIIRELERRFPERPIVHHGGLAYAMAFWSDRPFFQATIPLLMGKVGHLLPKAFQEDRAKLFPDRPFSYDAMKSVMPQMRDQWRAHVGMINDSLDPQCAFLAGAEPNVLDAHCYMNVWFLKNTLSDDADALLREFPLVHAWYDRVKAIGHGHFTKMDAKDALKIARAAQPEAKPHADAHEPNGRRPGDRVAIKPDDYGRDEVVGEILFTTAHEIAILRHDPELGDIAVHFPRAGYHVTPA